MAIQLPGDVEARIRQKVESGDFPDAGEVVREAMRLLDAQERQFEELRAKLKSGLDTLDRGEGVPFTPELVREMRRDTEERFHRGERPKGVDPLVREMRAEILRIAKANGATRVRIFGSFARGTARPDSDLDLLIDLEPDRTLLDLVAIKQDLEDLLGREVHVVTQASVSPHLRDRILQDATPL